MLSLLALLCIMLTDGVTPPRAFDFHAEHACNEYRKWTFDVVGCSRNGKEAWLYEELFALERLGTEWIEHFRKIRGRYRGEKHHV